MKNKKNIIAITMGDPSGISTELTIKSWNNKKTSYPFFVIHNPDFVSKIINKLKLKIKIKIIYNPQEASLFYKKYLPVFPIDLDKNTKLGKPNQKNSKQIIESINIAVDFAKRKKVAGIVTNPLSKEIINKFKNNFTGHTEYLAKLDNKKIFAMMLLNRKLKVIPITTHLPLKRVSKKITESLILDSIKLVNKCLKKDFKVNKPKIAITALNPHAGDGGLLGDEEKKIIIPSIKKAKNKGINAIGPLAADSAFRKANLNLYDAFICMYHDQALIAVKTIDFENTVNYTAGLSFIRTSPDHGTGYDIATKFIANEKSLIAAINYAGDISKKNYK
tara:strand:+ start:813 stop:1811 length:999 start_codon:yes stop_codon:yes gene_type:complete